MNNFSNPCKTCGKPTTYGQNGICQNCFQVESRIDVYIRSENGRAKLLCLLFKDHLERMANHAGRNEGDR